MNPCDFEEYLVQDVSGYWYFGVPGGDFVGLFSEHDLRAIVEEISRRNEEMDKAFNTKEQ